MAGHFFDSVLSNTTGRPVKGAVVEVFVATALVEGGRVTGEYAAIFSDDGITAIEQAADPLTSDHLGFFEFWTGESSVVIQISYSGRVIRIITDVEIVGDVPAAITALQNRVSTAEEVTENVTPFAALLLTREDATAVRETLGIGSTVAPVVTSDGSYTVIADDAGAYVRLIGEGPISIFVEFEEVITLPEFGEWHFRNASGVNATFVAGEGVAINAPAGGSITIPPNGTVTLKGVVPNEFDLFGVTVPA